MSSPVNFPPIEEWASEDEVYIYIIVVVGLLSLIGFGLGLYAFFYLKRMIQNRGILSTGSPQNYRTFTAEPTDHSVIDIPNDEAPVVGNVDVERLQTEQIVEQIPVQHIPCSSITSNLTAPPSRKTAFAITIEGDQLQFTADLSFWKSTLSSIDSDIFGKLARGVSELDDELKERVRSPRRTRRAVGTESSDTDSDSFRALPTLERAVQFHEVGGATGGARQRVRHTSGAARHTGSCVAKPSPMMTTLPEEMSEDSPSLSSTDSKITELQKTIEMLKQDRIPEPGRQLMHGLEVTLGPGNLRTIHYDDPQRASRASSSEPDIIGKMSMTDDEFSDRKEPERPISAQSRGSSLAGYTEDIKSRQWGVKKLSSSEKSLVTLADNLISTQESVPVGVVGFDQQEISTQEISEVSEGATAQRPSGAEASAHDDIKFELPRLPIEISPAPSELSSTKQTIGVLEATGGTKETSVVRDSSLPTSLGTLPQSTSNRSSRGPSSEVDILDRMYATDNEPSDKGDSDGPDSIQSRGSSLAGDTYEKKMEQWGIPRK